MILQARQRKVLLTTKTKVVTMRFLNKPFLSILLTLLIGVFSSHSVLAATAVASVSQNSVTKDEVFLLRVATDEKVSSGALDHSPPSEGFLRRHPKLWVRSMQIVMACHSV